LRWQVLALLVFPHHFHGETSFPCRLRETSFPCRLRETCFHWGV
jgi:hypothetical protein